MEVPRITKITLNMGLGEAVADKKIIENAVGDLTKIAGQKPVITKARKAQSLASRSVRVTRSVRWSRCAVRQCTNFWTVS